MAVLKLLRLVRKLAPELSTQIALHGQLLRVEWELEKKRWLTMVVLIITSFAFLLSALIFGGVTVIAYFWDTEYRTLSVGLTALAYLVGCGITFYSFTLFAARGRDAFVACKEELAADIAVFKSRL